MCHKILRFVKLQWHRDHWFIIVLFVLAIGGYVFLKTASEVGEGETMQVDNAILQAMRTPSDPSIPIGPSWLLPIAQDISALGGTAIITLMTIIVGGYFVISKRFRAAGFLVTSVTGATIGIIVLKTVFSRARPEIVPHLIQTWPSTSFPSGHSLISAMFYLTLGAILARDTTRNSLKWYAVGVAVFITFIVGLTRIYLGVHYPTDVLAGWCAGIAWATGTYALTLIVRRKRKKTGSVDVERPLDDRDRGQLN